MPKKLDLTGMRFGRLVALEEDPVRSSNGHIRWKCVCDCGNYKTVDSSHLKRGLIRSCGCLLIETTQQRNRETKRTHGQRNTRLYSIWHSLKQRVLNPNHTAFEHYGGRGISICEEWMQFEPFFQWSMENGYREDLTIERIDNDGDYSPGNCKWATSKEQANNRSNNTLITYDGKTMTISEWADYLEIPYDRLLKRITSGMPLDRALSKGTLFL